MVNYYSNIIAKTRNLGLLAIGLVSISSCKSIIEEDISEEVVIMIIPTQNDTIETNNVHFKWNELEGADNYRLQVVEPSFTNINTFVLDSLITGTEFYYSLNPGQYQFQLRAENSAYQSLYYGPVSFLVDSVSDLSSQIIPLVSPADAYYTNLSDLTFSWQSIFAADYYEFQLRSGADFDNSGTIIDSETLIYGSTYTTTGSALASEAEYSWGVRGVNQTSQTAFTSRSVFVDLTIPNDVSLVSPADASTAANDTLYFSWSYGTDQGTVQSPISYVLEIDDDSNFGSFTEYTTAIDSVEVPLTTGTFYWRVYAIDEAGNQSEFYSTENSVIIP
ncbi:MAG: hypothetical protein ABJG68_15785 [Crocinitomicaceae bacterium]